MPVVSAGVWQYSAEEAQDAVGKALAAGFTHIDTAYDYGNQQGVGQAIRNWLAGGRARESVFVTTKVPGCGAQNVSATSSARCRDDTSARIADDLRLLGLGHVDLLLLHFPPCAGEGGAAQSPGGSACFQNKTGCTRPGSCDMVRAQWDAVSEAYHKRLLRAVGVSNYCSACFECLEGTNATVLPMVNQVHYQVGMGPDPQGCKTLAESKGMVLQSWSPLGFGGKGSGPVMHGNLTTSLGKKYGKSPVQIALKWVVSKNVSVATKSSNPAHLAENLDIFDFELQEEDARMLDEADFASKDEPSFLCRDAAPGSHGRVEVTV